MEGPPHFGPAELSVTHDNERGWRVCLVGATNVALSTSCLTIFKLNTGCLYLQKCCSFVKLYLMLLLHCFSRQFSTLTKISCTFLVCENKSSICTDIQVVCHCNIVHLLYSNWRTMHYQKLMSWTVWKRRHWTNSNNCVEKWVFRGNVGLSRHWLTGV